MKKILYLLKNIYYEKFVYSFFNEFATDYSFQMPSIKLHFIKKNMKIYICKNLIIYRIFEKKWLRSMTYF